jgi:tetratricopeptide (TPR) repeat protein
MSFRMPSLIDPPDDGTVTARKRFQAAIAEAFELLGMGEPQKALAHIRPFADLAARSDAGAYVLGLIFFNADDPRTALGWFERAVSMNGAHVDALAARAIVLQRLGQPHEALLSYKAVLALRPDDVDTMFNIGVTQQCLGQMPEALAAYEAVLRTAPDHTDALANRGSLLERYQRFEDALACFTAIESLRPDDIGNLVNKASVLQRLGRTEAALRAYEAASRRSPQDADLEVSRGNLLQSIGRLDEAIECYDRAMIYGQLQPQTLLAKGLALQRLGRPEPAVAAYEATLDLDPGSCEALSNRGDALHELGRLAEAITSYDDALKIRPGFVPALVGRAAIFLRCGRYQDAVSACDDVLRRDPGHARAAGVRGAALYKLGHLDDALAALDDATQRDPSIAEAWLDRGDILRELDRHEDAIASYTEALCIRPAFPEALSGLGVALKDLGRVDEALARLDEALEQRPTYPDARYHRAGALLVSGLLKAGFDDLESRWDRSNAPPRTVVTVLPAWDGGDLKGKPILVWDEQGSGDLIQFARYLPFLVELGADVTFLCRKKMHRLLRGLTGPIRLVESRDPDAKFAAQSALMSLPRGFQTTLDTIPARIPYLRAETDLVARWAERIGSDGFRIGICWRGALLDRHRSIPLSSFAPLAAIEGVRLVSLQKEQDPRELEERGVPVESLGEDFDAGPDSFLDCAAVMATLDLVVTVDSSIAHLAGALGRPVLVALEQVAHWRWLRHRDDSPWYPTMRLFRQARKGDWDGVLERMVAWVEPLAAARKIMRDPALPPTRISIPVSVGELIDKMTLLEIEESRIGDPAKLADVRHELALLRMVRLEAGLGSERLCALEADLKDVNMQLLRVEDRLRTHGAHGGLDAELVDLARQASRITDARAGLKHAIDSLHLSTIVEIKSESDGIDPRS